MGDDSPGTPGRSAARPAWTASGLVLIAITGLADYLSGYEVSIALFYLLPIAIVAYRAGRLLGAFAASCAGLTWYLADAAVGHPYSSPWHLYWNSGIRFGIFMVVALLLSELRAKVDRVRSQAAKLEELNRLKNTFIGMAAHDLRNPAAVIQIYSDLILEAPDSRLTERQLKCLEVIRVKSRFMLELVNDLLDISLIESGRLVLEATVGDFGRFVTAQLAPHETLAGGRGVSIQSRIDANLPAVRFDGDRIGQVLDNLVLNALKFSAAGSSLTVEVRGRSDGVETRVSDEGPGIPAEEIELVFQEFQKSSVTPPRGERGTGLGLAIAKKIVESHGGAIGVESRLGAGTCFFFTLPAAGDGHPPPPVASPSPPG